MMNAGCGTAREFAAGTAKFGMASEMSPLTVWLLLSLALKLTANSLATSAPILGA